MKKFIRKMTILVTALVAINLLLLCAVPKDKNGYLCEYKDKIQLLDSVSQPRIIFIGGSSVAFGTDSKTIGDSLHCNVVNFGLHGGIGIRYPLDDALQYIGKGDVVVLQFEYGNFFSGGNGEAETFPRFMVENDWRNFDRLNFKQWEYILSGIPMEALKNLKRLAVFLLRGSFDTPTVNNKFMYVKSGFNEYGDEVSHLSYPSVEYSSSNKTNTKQVHSEFMSWLADAITKYEQAGATVIMLPPVCVESHFKATYNDNVEQALKEINHPYLVSPESMVVDDSCSFNTGYHMNEEGVRQNTTNIITTLKQLEIVPN